MLRRIHEKLFKLSHLPGHFLAIIELARELVISNMHNRFENDTWKTFRAITLTLRMPRVMIWIQNTDYDQDQEFIKKKDCAWGHGTID